MKTKSKSRAQETWRSAIPRWIWSILLLVVLGIVAYWNSFDAPLVFDDLVSIQKNTGVRFGDYLKPALLTTRPVLYLTFAMNYAFHGQDVWGYHLISLVLHLLNGILVFFIARHIFRIRLLDERPSTTCALWAAALFVVHPVQTESVTYISSRSELLSAFFYAAALLVFVKSSDQKVGFVLSLVVAALFLLGLLSKETAITLPATLALYDFLFRSEGRIRPILSRWRFYITFVVGGAIAIYFLVTVILRGSIGALEGHLTPFSYFLTQLRVITTYMQIVFLPLGLNLDYDFRPSSSPFDAAVIASGLVLIATLGLGWFFRRRQPILSFSIFWFFITLSPTSSFVPILDVIFEHRLYLPMLGVCLSFPVLMETAAHWFNDKWRLLLNPAFCGGAVIVVLLAGTILRNHVWRDEVRLWTDVIAKSPQKSRPYNGLSSAYYKRGQYDKALEASRQGTENVREGKEGFLETVGNMSLKLGRYEDAVQAFVESSKTPDKRKRGLAYNNVGVSYLYIWHALQRKRSEISEEQFNREKQEILGKAQEAFSKCLDEDPSVFWPLDSFVDVLHHRGKDSEVEAELIARYHDKSDFRVVYAIGKSAFLQGDYATANEYFERASKQKSEKVIFFNHAYALTELKQVDRAIEKYLLALREDPLFNEAHYNVALLYEAKQDLHNAIAHLNEVLRMDPMNTLSHLTLAKIYMKERKRAEAREHLRVILNSSPGHQEAASLWQQIGS